MGVRDGVELRVPDDVVDGVRRATLTSEVDLPNCVIHVTLKSPSGFTFDASGQTALAVPFEASVGCVAVRQVAFPSQTIIGGTGDNPATRSRRRQHQTQL